MRRVAVVLVLATIAGCDADDEHRSAESRAPATTAARPEPPTTRSDPARGFTLAVPASWHLADARMSRISDPRELFSLATMPMRWHATDCEAFAGAVGVAMSSRDVAITVWERGHDRDGEWHDFPRRPEHFGPVRDGEPAGAGCAEPPGTRTHWRNFADAGRHFHSLARIGADAPPEAAAAAWRALDSLRLDGDYRPDWRSSG